MANDFTKRGHKLSHVKGLIFECSSEHFVRWTEKDAYEKGSPFVLAHLQVFAPCTQGQIVATLRAWLNAYGDDELLEQVDKVVVEVLEAMPDLPSGTPSVMPQRGQAN